MTAGRAQSVTVRLFVAVSVPDQIVDLLRGWPRPESRKVRYTTEMQWHVTLRFLGEIAHPEPVVDALQSVPAILGALRVPVHAVMGPRVAWLPGGRVLQLPVWGLEALAASVLEATPGWGSEPDRPFLGHLTLARARGPGPGPQALAGASLSGSFPVGRLTLYSSVAGPRGAEYEPLAGVALPL